LAFLGCVDLWEPKVLRSGAGAHFRTAIVSGVEWNELETNVDSEASVFLADNSGRFLEDIQENEKEEDNIENANELLHEDEENTIKHIPEISESLELYRSRLSSIPVIPYFAVNYINQTPIILIVGGETEGLSINAFTLAHDRCGVRLNVPLSNNVESLNSGTALGIIVFEMKRQFLTESQHKAGERASGSMERFHLPNV
jgi:tRNA G18 (ribose-2'-O)-methylase SpoU